MKKFTNFALLIIATISILLVTGCGKKKKDLPPVQSQNTPSIEIKKNHSWYYFTNQSFKQIDKVEKVPPQALIPWTEAIRISSASCQTDSEAMVNKGFAVINRLGILTFEEEKISISKDVSLFADRTAGNLIFLNNRPLFSVYKSSFFNDTITDPDYKKQAETHLFLIQFDDIAKISYPVINCNNLTQAPNSEITDFNWDGLNFYCSVKSITDTKNAFSYLKFKTTSPLLSLSPSSSKDSLVIQEISVDDFRAKKALLSYQEAPQRVKSLLAGFSQDLPFTIEVKSAGSSSPRIYQNQIAGSSEKELQAKAIVSPSWSAALFEDGTLYLEGALPGKHILRGGKAVAVRLPKLPVNFVYSDFVISGTSLYAAWEEIKFYKTGRSGFLQVNLDKSLYSKLL
ncbi:MAG: hypothetical protein K6C97_04580 [Treponema sp.]|nr:hypothetical protein [Treponema sp.]